jgi:hypothetical protein
MKYFASPSFWDCYGHLPSAVQELADRCFDLLKAQPNHPSLHLKKIGRFWSVRVGRKYRALAVEIDAGMLWFWIGTHAEYDKLVR